MRKISGLVTAGPKKHGRTSWAHFLQSPELCGTGWYRRKPHSLCTILGMDVKVSQKITGAKCTGRESIGRGTGWTGSFWKRLFLFHVNQKQFPNQFVQCLTVFPTTPRDVCHTQDHDLCLLGSAKGVTHSPGASWDAKHGLNQQKYIGTLVTSPITVGIQVVVFSTFCKRGLLWQ